jgi:hypothetical protein
MNGRSIGGNRRSIQWSSLNKKETRQDQRGSTGWIDGSAAVHPMVTWKLTVRFWLRDLQHRMIRRCVNSHVRWRATTSSTGWTNAWKSIASDHPMVLLSANDSSDALGYLYLLHSSIWGCWIVWKCRECKTPTRSYPMHPSAKLPIHRLAYA